GRADLLAQRSLAEARGCHVRREAQVRAFELEALRIGQRGLRLDGAPHTAKKVQRVADVDADVVERERRRTGSGAAGRSAIELVDVAARGAGLCVDTREKCAACRVGVFLSL